MVSSKAHLKSIIAKDHEGSGPRVRRQRPFENPWKILMGVAALLDFLSTLTNRRFFARDKEAAVPAVPESRFGFLSQSLLLGHFFAQHNTCIEEVVGDEGHFRIFSQNFELPHQVFTSVFLWLNTYSVHLGFIFSVLWCIEAFFEADRWADRRFSEIERRKIMANVHVLLKRRSLRASLSSTEENVENFKTFLFYYGSLITQFLLLPLGFYLLIYKYIVVQATAAWDNEGPEEIKALLESTYESVHLPQEYRTFSNETKLALGFAIAKHSGKAVYAATGAKVKRWLWREGLSEGRRRGLNAIRHPLRSMRNAFLSFMRAREVLRWVRWVKYLTPLARRIVKLRSNIRGLIVAYNQRRQRKIAQRRRRRMWKRMNTEQRRSKASKIIQSTYRSYKQRQACMQIVISRQEVNDLAATKIQLAMRLMMETANAKKMERQSELERLEKRESISLRTATMQSLLDQSERERLNELREQQESAKSESIDRRLLMKPDSKFQVFWKVLLISCVLLELVCIGLNMRLKRGDQTLKAKLEELLIPEPVTHLKECSCLARFQHDFSKWEREAPKRRKCRGEPWYCNPIYYNSQMAYTASIMFVLEQILALFALVALLDVPISFYTGVYQPETGVLGPKPFIHRWLCPGLLTQLLTNPRMGKISNRVFRILQSSFEIGPIRVLRWSKCLFYPSLLCAFDWTESNVWLPLVAFANGPAGTALLEVGRLDKSVPLRRRSSIDPSLPPSIFDPDLCKSLPAGTRRSLLRRGSSLSTRMSFSISVQQSTELLIKRSLNDSTVFSFLDEDECKSQ